MLHKLTGSPNTEKREKNNKVRNTQNLIENQYLVRFLARFDLKFHTQVIHIDLH
jgi:hypothetical protein